MIAPSVQCIKLPPSLSYNSIFIVWWTFWRISISLNKNFHSVLDLETEFFTCLQVEFYLLTSWEFGGNFEKNFFFVCFSNLKKILKYNCNIVKMFRFESFDLKCFSRWLHSHLRFFFSLASRIYSIFFSELRIFNGIDTYRNIFGEHSEKNCWSENFCENLLFERKSQNETKKRCFETFIPEMQAWHSTGSAPLQLCIMAQDCTPLESPWRWTMIFTNTKHNPNVNPCWL